MKSAQRNRMMIVVGAALSIAGLLGGCAQAGPAPAASGKCNPHTVAEVLKATDNRVEPVYEVPGCLKKKYNLAFINPGFSVAYFSVWHQAMKDAAAYYGVNFSDVDLQLKFDETVAQYNALAIKQPDVIGALYAPALVDASKKDGIIYLNMGKSIDGYKYNYGASDETAVGKLGGVTIAKIEAKKSSWSGRDVYLVLLGAAGDTEVTKRLKGAVAGYTSVTGVAADHVLNVETGCQPDTARARAADVLTAHPDAALVFFGCNDEAGVAALSAIREAGRGDDSLLVTYGADDAGVAAMKQDDTGSYAAMVDFNPYTQGWNWVAAAIASAQGKTYRAYTDIKVNSIVTPASVDAHK